MLYPSYPPFDHENQHRSPITKDAAEEFDCDVDPLMPPALAGRRRRADTSPRARRKKDHRDDSDTLARISSLGDDERHIMKDYAGNTPETRLETLSKLEDYRQQYGGPPIKAEGQLGPKKGKTGVDWICMLCQERKNTFQKIAGHITSHHWKLKVWKCLDTSCGRNYCSLNELTRHTKETHRTKRPERSNTTQISPKQPGIRSSAAPDASPPRTYRSGSNYSDSVSPPRPQPLYPLPNPSSRRPRGSWGPTQESALVHRYSTRSSRPAPYDSQESKLTHLRKSSSAILDADQLRNQQRRSVHRNEPSAADPRHPPPSTGHTTYQDMSKSHYDPALNESLYNPSTQLRTSPAHKSTNSTDETASHVASGSYSEGEDVSIYPTIPRAQYYDAFSHPTERYHPVISEEPTPRAGSHQDHFQPQNYTNQTNVNSNYAKYPSVWQATDDLAAFSVAPDTLQAIPRHTSPTIYGPLEKHFYITEPYSPVHSLDNQPGTGRPSDNTFDSFIRYLDDDRYIHYEGDSNQVSRRWLP